MFEGAMLSVLSACLFGTNNVCIRRGVVAGDVTSAMAVTILSGAVLFSVVVVATGGFDRLDGVSPFAIMLFGAAGVTQFVWGRFWYYRATSALGSLGAAPFMQGQMLFASAFAIAFLGEVITVGIGVGIVFLICGSLFVMGGLQKRAGSGGRVAGGKLVAFKPRVREGLVAGLLSLLGYGVGPVLIKAGLADANAPLLSAFVAYVSAAIVFVGIIIIFRLKTDAIYERSWGVLLWYGASGILVFLAQFCRFVAFSLAPIVVVMPLQSLAPIAMFVTGLLINRDAEVVNRRVIGGLVLAVTGGILVGLSTAGTGGA